MLKGIKHYLERGHLKKGEPDPSMSISLMDKAERRLKRVAGEDVDERNSDLLFEDAYEAIREAAQAAMASEGFKPYSHEATIAFLDERCPQLSDYEIATIDRHRQMRNNSVYRSEKIDVKEAVEAIEFAERIVKKIKRVLK